jgi:hypothetical protein
MLCEMIVYAAASADEKANQTRDDDALISLCANPTSGLNG